MKIIKSYVDNDIAVLGVGEIYDTQTVACLSCGLYMNIIPKSVFENNGQYTLMCRNCGTYNTIKVTLKIETQPTPQGGEGDNEY